MGASLQMRRDDAFPDGVALLVHVQAVGHKDVRQRLAVGSEHLRVGVDVIEVVAALAEVGDELVRGAHRFDLGPARRVAGNRDEGDPRLRQLRADFSHERLEVRQHLLGRFLRVDVVAARVHHDELRLVREDDALGERHRIDHLRSTEAAVDDLMPGKILRERLPEADARTADEKNRVRRRRVRLIARLEGGDVLLPLGGGRCGRRSNRRRLRLRRRGQGEENRGENGWNKGEGTR